MKLKVIEVVRQLLVKNAQLRDSDKLLIWEFWKLEGHVRFEDGLFGGWKIRQEDFMQATHPESIRRSAAYIRESERKKCIEDPEYINSPDCLLGSKDVESYRWDKEAMKGMFVYKEETEVEL